MLSEFLTPEYNEYEEVQTSLEAFGRCAEFLSNNAQRLANNDNFMMMDGYLTSIGFESASEKDGEEKKDGILKRAWEAIKAFFARIKQWFSKVLSQTRRLITGMENDEARRTAPVQIKAVRTFCTSNRTMADQVLETEIGQRISTSAVHSLGNNKGLETIVTKGFKSIVPDLASFSKELEALKTIIVRANDKNFVYLNKATVKLDDPSTVELNENHLKIEPLGELLNEKPTKAIPYLKYLMTSGDILETSSITTFKLKEYEKTLDAIANLFDKFDKRLGSEYRSYQDDYFTRLNLKATVASYQLIIKLSNTVFRDHKIVLSYFHLRENQWANSHSTLLQIMESMKKFAEPSEKESVDKTIKSLKDGWKGVNAVVRMVASNEDYSNGLVGKAKAFIEWMTDLIKRCVERIRKFLGYKRNEKDAAFADRWHVIAPAIREAVRSEQKVEELYKLTLSKDASVNALAFAPGGAKASFLIKELDEQLLLCKRVAKLVTEMNTGNFEQKANEIQDVANKDKAGHKEFGRHDLHDMLNDHYDQDPFFEKGVFANLLHDALHKKNYDSQLEDALKALKAAFDDKKQPTNVSIETALTVRRHVRGIIEQTIYLQRLLIAGSVGNETIRKAIVERTPTVLRSLINNPTTRRGARAKLEKAESYL